MTTYQVLAAMVAALSKIPNVTTCRLGLEEGLTADDYPLIRVVLSETRDSEQGNPFKPLMGILVYYGELAQPFDQGGIAAQYEWLMDMEHAIKTALIPTGKGWKAHWIETVFDEDRLPGFKLFASRFEVWGF
jgi:hypothetical protein